MQAESHTDNTTRLIALVQSSPWLMDALHTVRALGLPAWCIGAGAIRNLVWDDLHGKHSPSHLTDVDVAYFDATQLGTARDAELQRTLAHYRPDVPWEVTNQAAVHLWFESYFGHPVAPLHSLQESVATWPEYATAVGVCLQADGTISIIAPHGLNDLFACVVQRNPARVSIATYRQRVAQKRYAERWPQVRIIPC